MVQNCNNHHSPPSSKSSVAPPMSTITISHAIIDHRYQNDHHNRYQNLTVMKHYMYVIIVCVCVCVCVYVCACDQREDSIIASVVHGNTEYITDNSNSKRG